MRTATIKGYITATVKHPSFDGQRLLVAQPDNPDGSPAGPPQVVIDPIGAAIHQRVLISSDGTESRTTVADKSSPARWIVLGTL